MNLKTMSLQAIFDHVATHLLTQNAKSEESTETGFRCMYRGEYGRKCAVGACIDDAGYRCGMEGLAVTSEAVLPIIGFSLADKFSPPVTLLKKLQNLHDTRAVSLWREELQYLAGRYRLSGAVVTQFPCTPSAPGTTL